MAHLFPSWTIAYPCCESSGRYFALAGVVCSPSQRRYLSNQTVFQSKFISQMSRATSENQHISSHSFHCVCLPMGGTKVGWALCLFVCVFKACCQMSSSAPLWNCITHSVNINWRHLVLDKQSYRGSWARACVYLFERYWNNSVMHEISSELYDH